MIFLKVYYKVYQTSLLVSLSRDENCILIIRKLTALASSASVMQISGGSTPLAKDGDKVFCLVFLLASPTFLCSATLFYPKSLSATPHIRLGFDVHSVETCFLSCLKTCDNITLSRIT